MIQLFESVYSAHHDATTMKLLTMNEMKEPRMETDIEASCHRQMQME